MAKKEKGPTPAQAMDAMRPDVEKVLKGTLSGFPVDEYNSGERECGGSELVDSRDASKLIYTTYLEVVGDAADERSPQELLNESLERFEKLDWNKYSHKDNSSGVTAKMKKSDAAGKIVLYAERPETKSGNTVPILRVNLVTDCLRNPDWEK